MASNWTRILNPTTIATMQFTFRSMPFKNIPSGGADQFPVKINGVNAQAPFAGPPAILIGSNGLGVSDLFDRLLFNYSADYGYTFDPTITKTIAKEDGSKAVGKTWAETGTAPAGTANTVREEDMPRNFRIIPPQKGVAGITHNMNRLNLVLGEDGKTITWAFWE